MRRRTLKRTVLFRRLVENHVYFIPIDC